jgi:hypothetical protein
VPGEKLKQKKSRTRLQREDTRRRNSSKGREKKEPKQNKQKNKSQSTGKRTYKTQRSFWVFGRVCFFSVGMF